nr:MAG TPA: hypothetical protein [Caudoviricetes sp.]
MYYISPYSLANSNQHNSLNPLPFCSIKFATLNPFSLHKNCSWFPMRADYIINLFLIVSHFECQSLTPYELTF